jgi:hypothetical protein
MYLDAFGFTSLPLERDHPPLVWEGRKYWLVSVHPVDSVANTPLHGSSELPKSPEVTNAGTF